MSITPKSTLSPKRRETRARKTRLIVQAALALVEQGLEGLTIQRLAKELGWATGALYRYFPSKDALLGELQRVVIRQYGEDLATILADSRASELSDLGRIYVAGRHYQHWFLQRRGAFVLVAGVLGDPRHLLPDAEGLQVMEEVVRVLSQLRALFEQCSATGRLRTGPANDRTLVFWSTAQGTTQLHKLSRFAPEEIVPARLLRTSVQALLLGWGADAITLSMEMQQADQWLKESLECSH